MKILKSLFAIILVSFFVVSCGDSGSDPVLTISSPLDGASVQVGADVVISVQATDDVGVSSITFNSTDLNFSESVSGFQNGLDARVDFTLGIAQGTPAGEYEIEVTATDTDNNTDTESIKINVVQ